MYQVLVRRKKNQLTLLILKKKIKITLNTIKWS